MMNRGENSNAIPKDLIIEIFSRLPEKSICRFLCLSKEWKSVIGSQYFIDLFHSMSSSKPHLLVLLRNDRDWKLFSFHQPLSSPVADSVFRAKISEYHIPYKGCDMARYASGLIYFPRNGEGHGIYNPSTRQYAVLPPIKISNGYIGFDPIGKQYKVLIFKESQDGVYFYDILTSGRRREFKCPSTYRPYIYDHVSICINGVLYYRNHDLDFIGCFDVRSEKLFKFECPPRSGLIETFVSYKGKLGLVNVHLRANDFTFTDFYLDTTIWVLEDLDKLEWTKHVYRVMDLMPGIPYYDCQISVIGVTDSGDIVLAETFTQKTVSCFLL